jgi:folate-binding protein YgfZ
MLIDKKNYDATLMVHGIPRSNVDMIHQSSLPLQCNLDMLNAISFQKGCYLGQELTARTHFQGLIRKRLMPVQLVPVDGQDTNEPSPPSASPSSSPGSTLLGEKGQSYIQDSALQLQKQQKHFHIMQQLTTQLFSQPSPQSPLLPSHFDARVAPHPSPGATIHVGDRAVGTLLSSVCNTGLAEIRLMYISPDNVLHLNKTLQVVPYIPLWWKLDDQPVEASPA